MRKQTLKTLMTLPALMFTVACQDGPAAPELDAPATMEAVAFGSPTFQLTTTEGLTALRWTSPLNADLNETGKIGKFGGVLSSPAGIDLVVPPRALRKPTRINVMARAGEDVAFAFGPHGLQFDLPVMVRIKLSDLANGDLILDSVNAPAIGQIQIGSLTAIYYSDQDGEVVETIETFPVFILDGEFLVFFTDHFSGYALAA